MGTKYAPRGEGEGASGWRRIGRYDLARRRALWARLILKAKVGDEICDADVLGIELCAGREGDDAHVKLGPGGMWSAWWTDLVDVMLRAMEAAEEDPASPLAAGYLVVRDGDEHLSTWEIEPVPGDLDCVETEANWTRSKKRARRFDDLEFATALARLFGGKVVRASDGSEVP